LSVKWQLLISSFGKNNQSRSRTWWAVQMFLLQPSTKIKQSFNWKWFRARSSQNNLLSTFKIKGVALNWQGVILKLNRLGWKCIYLEISLFNLISLTSSFKTLSFELFKLGVSKYGSRYFFYFLHSNSVSTITFCLFNICLYIVNHIKSNGNLFF